MAHKYVYLFADGKAEGTGKMKDLLGGKGAGLAEMTNAGLPVPPGFTITTEACNAYYAAGEKFPEGQADGYMDRGVFTLDDLRVRRGAGKAGITLRGKVDRHWKLDMELLADGLIGDEVAERLFLSAETVKTHIRNAMSKLEARNRCHAIAIALRDGQISGSPGGTSAG